MTGCERCGAQALAGESTCPVCGAGLRGAGRAGSPRGGVHIPVRRHGTMPPPPLELRAAPEPGGLVSMAALALGAIGTALIAAGLGYWLW